MTGLSTANGGGEKGREGLVIMFGPSVNGEVVQGWRGYEAGVMRMKKKRCGVNLLIILLLLCLLFTVS